MAVALWVLGYVLATWHASPDEAIASHLGVAESLLRWFPPGGSGYCLLLVPNVGGYWRLAARERRLAYRAPDLTAAAIESAAIKPENHRVATVLSAAAGGFRVRGGHDVLERLRSLSLPLPPA